MSIRHTLDVIDQRLDTLLSIPESERTDFVNGSVAQLTWCRDQINQGIRSILPSERDEEGEDGEDFDASFTSHGGPATWMSLNRPARVGAKACKPGREHAYQFHQPQRDYKQCRHCGDVQRMIHGEKISYGKRNKALHS